MPSDEGPLVFGDVVLVPFPFTDQTRTKRRPAVVISAAAYNREMPDVILMPITSQLRGDVRSHDVVVEGWERAGLLKPSAVKPLIATVERRLILRRLGRLSADDEAMLRRALAVLVG